MNKYNPHGSEINIDLWLGDSWTDNDLNELRDCLKQFGTVSGQRSYGLRGLGLQVAFAFVTGALAHGFFKALGGDAYTLLKKKLIEVIRRPYKTRPETEGKDLLTFSISDSEARFEMRIQGWYRTQQELDDYLADVPSVFIAAWSAFTSRTFPFISEKNHDVCAEWGRNEPGWQVSVRTRTNRDVEADQCLAKVVRDARLTKGKDRDEVRNIIITT